jgi:hypothetical protein
MPDPLGLVRSARHCDQPEWVIIEFNDRAVTAERVYESPATEGPVVYDCEDDGYPVRHRGRRCADGADPGLLPRFSRARRRTIAAQTASCRGADDSPCVAMDIG